MNVESDLRFRLLQAALQLLEEDGTAPSLRAVARTVGVSAMTPYGYFADKAALMGAVADQGFQMLAAHLDVADSHTDPAEALIAQGLAYVDFAEAHPSVFRLIYSHEYGHAQTELVTKTYNILLRRVQSLIPSAPSAGTLACRALVQGLANITLSGRLNPSGRGDIEAAIRLLVGGLLAAR